MGTNGGRRACLVLDSSTSRSGVGAASLWGSRKILKLFLPAPADHAKDMCKAPSSAGPGHDLRGRGLVPPPRRSTASLGQLRTAGLEEDGCGGDKPMGAQPKGPGSPLSLTHTQRAGWQAPV